MSFKGFSSFSSGHHFFFQPSRTILAILVEGHWRNTSLQIFWNRAIGQERDVVWRFSIFSSGGHLVQWSGTTVAILDFHNFSSFWSRSHHVATEQVWAQRDQRFGKRCRKLIFKMAAVAAILDFLSAHLAILWLLSALMKMAAVAIILDFLSAHLAILWLLSALMLIIKFAFNWIIEEMSKIWNSQQFFHINV